MSQGRRINRIHTPSIDVKLRLDMGVLCSITLWREDHFTQVTRSPASGGPVVQRYLVLDFGQEERAETVTDMIDDPTYGPRPVPKLDDDGNAVIEWRATGAIHVELQRVDDHGAGLSHPTVKIIPAVTEGTIDSGWIGWEHQDDSPRRPGAVPYVVLRGGTMDVAGNLDTVKLLADDLIANYRMTGDHVGLSVNFAERRCYVCDEVWPCVKATDWGAVRDVDPESEAERVDGEAAASG